VDPLDARAIAHWSHLEARNRFGELQLEHLARVAAAVPSDDEATAWLHDVLEGTDVSPAQLRHAGMSDVEYAALQLLTREPTESYELYVLRIAHAAGDEGRLARSIKVADLDDHLAHEHIPPDAPPYAWARGHVVGAQLRRRECSSRAEPGAA
jgi:hypothetical protein